MKIKYEDVPFEFALKHRAQAEAECDAETPMFCYCKRLATGFHTQTCRRYISHLQSKIVKLYKESLKGRPGNLPESDYYNGIPKCIQYRDLADKGAFSNPFYLRPSKSHKDIVGSVYEIIGGLWNLRIHSYNPDTGVLRGRPTLYPEQELREFKAIPITEGIKGMYLFGTDADQTNLERLIKLSKL